jgi:hypothetical protein
MSETPPEERPRAKVRAAVKVLNRQRDLLEVAEGSLLAVFPLAFSRRVFKDGEEAKDVVEIVAVNLDGAQPELLGTVEVNWTRVVRALAADPKSWQVGTLIEEPEYKAVELKPAGKDVDLDAIAETLGHLQVAALSPPKQLELTVGEKETATEDSPPARSEFVDDEIPF